MTEISQQLTDQGAAPGDAEALQAFLTDPEVAERDPGQPLPMSVLRRHRAVLGMTDADITATERARGSRD